MQKRSRRRWSRSRPSRGSARTPASATEVLLGLRLGSRESYACWLDLGRDLIGRGLNAPALVIADGAPGIWKAVGELWPEQSSSAARSTPCALAKLPERHHAELKARWWQIFDEAAAPGEAKAALLALAEEYRRAYPSAMRTIAENVEELVSHLLFPSCHRKRLRSTNLLERTFVEVRRRTKVIGRFPGETSALSLIWAVLELASPKRYVRVKLPGKWDATEANARRSAS